MLQHDAPTAYLRPATEADLLLYYEWANDLDVRAGSFGTEPIPLEQHRAWFARKLESASVLMLVLEAPEPVGQVRFEVTNDVAMIGFSLAARARGRGLGSYLLRNGSHCLHTRFPNVRIARGLVKANNVASRRAFEAAGFQLVPATPDKGVPTVTYDIDLLQFDASANTV